MFDEGTRLPIGNAQVVIKPFVVGFTAPPDPCKATTGPDSVSQLSRVGRWDVSRLEVVGPDHKPFAALIDTGFGESSEMASMNELLAPVVPWARAGDKPAVFEVFLKR